jgi:hypothetical protein
MAQCSVTYRDNFTFTFHVFGFPLVRNIRTESWTSELDAGRKVDKVTVSRGLGYTPVEVEVEVNLRPTVSRPVCLGVRLPSRTRDQFFFLLEISFRQLRVFYFVVPSLTRGRVCNLMYNCFWALPEQSLLGRSTAELTAIVYCLI